MTNHPDQLEKLFFHVALEKIVSVALSRTQVGTFLLSNDAYSLGTPKRQGECRVDKVMLCRIPHFQLRDSHHYGRIHGLYFHNFSFTSLQMDDIRSSSRTYIDR